MFNINKSVKILPNSLQSLPLILRRGTVDGSL